MATTQAMFKPIAALLFWYSLSAYRKSMGEAGRWQVD